MEPEECLRSLTDDAVRRTEAGELVLDCTLGVRAAVNAFVMLGLVPQSLAEKILAEYTEALGQRSLGTSWGMHEGELPSSSGAHEVWAAHVGGPPELAGVPLAMAPATAGFPMMIAGLAADLRFEWVKLSGAEWRISFRASADDPGGEPDRPSVVMREALAMFTVTDDAGNRYRPRVEAVTWERVPPGRQEWRGDLVAEASPAAPRPAWFQVASTDAPVSARIALDKAFASEGTAPRPAALAAAPRWPTPAEGFLDALARVGDVKAGWTDVVADKTAEIVAVVADCLLAVGALPPGSQLLRPGPAAPHAPTWQDALAARWARRAHLTVTAAGTRHRVLLSPLPLKHASAVVETVYASGGTAAGTLVGITLHGSPWVPGAGWPLIAPCFSVYARDDAGNTYEGVLAGFRQDASTEGVGTFWLWPPVADKQTDVEASEQATEQVGVQAGEQAGKQATWQAGQQAGEQGDKQATGQAGEQATEQAGVQAGEQAGKQATEQAGQQAGEQGGEQAGVPAGDAGGTTLTVTIATLWEAARIQVPLPR
jgi:hypothetical protein